MGEISDRAEYFGRRQRLVVRRRERGNLPVSEAGTTIGFARAKRRLELLKSTALGSGSVALKPPPSRMSVSVMPDSFRFDRSMRDPIVVVDRNLLTELVGMDHAPDVCLELARRELADAQVLAKKATEALSRAQLLIAQIEEQIRKRTK